MPLFKKLIYSKQTKSQNIYVYENLIHRWLCFDDVFIQTIINKYFPQRPLLKYLPSLCVNIKKNDRVTMLGAGAGAISHYIHHYHPTTQLTLVEKNKFIINIANDLFKVKEKIIQKDAIEYVKNMTICEHIFIDIFTNQNHPSLIHNADFLLNCQSKALSTVSINLLSPSPFELNQLIGLIRHIFNQKTLCLFVKNKSNIIIHAFIDDSYMTQIKQLQRDKVINKPHWFSDKGLVSMLC